MPLVTKTTGRVPASVRRTGISVLRRLWGGSSKFKPDTINTALFRIATTMLDPAAERHTMLLSLLLTPEHQRTNNQRRDVAFTILQVGKWTCIYFAVAHRSFNCTSHCLRNLTGKRWKCFTVRWYRRGRVPKEKYLYTPFVFKLLSLFTFCEHVFFKILILIYKIISHFKFL
jgi:hypothetical protein